MGVFRRDGYRAPHLPQRNAHWETIRIDHRADFAGQRRVIVPSIVFCSE
jgi:hypothetical protein